MPDGIKRSHDLELGAWCIRILVNAACNAESRLSFSITATMFPCPHGIGKVEEAAELLALFAGEKVPVRRPGTLFRSQEILKAWLFDQTGEGAACERKQCLVLELQFSNDLELELNGQRQQRRGSHGENERWGPSRYSGVVLILKKL